MDSSSPQGGALSDGELPDLVDVVQRKKEKRRSSRHGGKVMPSRTTNNNNNNIGSQTSEPVRTTLPSYVPVILTETYNNRTQQGSSDMFRVPNVPDYNPSTRPTMYSMASPSPYRPIRPLPSVTNISSFNAVNIGQMTNAPHNPPTYVPFNNPNNGSQWTGSMLNLYNPGLNDNPTVRGGCAMQGGSTVGVSNPANMGHTNYPFGQTPYMNSNSTYASNAGQASTVGQGSNIGHSSNINIGNLGYAAYNSHLPNVNRPSNVSHGMPLVEHIHSSTLRVNQVDSMNRLGGAGGTNPVPTAQPGR